MRRGDLTIAFFLSRLNNCLLLSEAVQPLGLQDEVVREAIVENSESRPQYCFRSSFFCAATQSPGKTDSRSEITMIMDLILGLETQAVTESYVGTNPPVILRIES